MRPGQGRAMGLWALGLFLLLAPCGLFAQAPSSGSPVVTRTKFNDAEALLEFLGQNTVEFIGRSAEMLLRLDALEELIFPTCYSPSFGFPPELFALPKLVSFRTRGCNFRAFPPVITPTLRSFAIIAANFSIPIPNTFPWATMTEFNVQRSEIRCPLPQGFIDRANNSLTDPAGWGCNLSDNNIWLEDGKICGQIKPSQLTCRFWPQRPNSLEVAPPTSPALITSYQQWQVEFKEIAIRIFKKDAAGNVQRGKYLSITVCPPQGGTNVSPRALDAAPLRTFRWLNISILQVDLEFRSRTGGVMAGYVLLDFNPDTGNILFDKDLLSFSTRIVNFNITLTSAEEYPYRYSTLYLFKSQHSIPGTRAPLCLRSLTSCNSSFGELSATLIPTESVLECTMKSTSFPFGLALTSAKINGVDALQSLGFDFNFWNLGDAIDILETAQGIGPDGVPIANAIEDQAIMALTTLSLALNQPILGVLEIPAPAWYSRSIPEPLLPPSEALVVAPSSNVGTIAGVIVAIVAVAALVAGALLLRRKMLLDRASRTAAVVASVELLEEQQLQRRRAQGKLVYMQQLGAGSSGSVMLGTYNGAFVAVKRLHDSNTKASQSKREDLRQLLSEADTMASVKNNRNVVKLIDVIEEEVFEEEAGEAAQKQAGKKGLAIVMEFCPRGSLANHFKKQNQLTDYDMFKFAYGISNGMAALALAGVVHRDLACRNVLLSEHLHAKVSDFGLATKVADGITVQDGGGSDDLGPIKWQAPEVVASDVWAYGCCLIEIATGQPPFYGFKGSILDLRTKIQTQSYSPLQHLEDSKGREHRDKIPEWMAGALRSCFHAIPTSRPSFREIRYSLAKGAREWKNRFEDEVDEIESMLSAPGTYSESYSTSSGVDAAPSALDPASLASKTLVLSRPALSTTAARVDLYSIERLSKLGAGSFGSVFLGQSQGVYVAIKVLDATSDKEDEVKREADVMLSIQPHRNIVQIYGLISQQNQLSIVMEFAPRGSLESFVISQLQQPGATIPEAQLFRFAVGIARGMASLCACGVIHRDLAMRNILLDSSLEPKVSDFGLARTVLDPNEESNTKTDIGPIRWFAPECYDMKYSEKSDVWAFGCTLVEMMTGNIPFASIKLLEVVEAVREHKQSPLAYMSAESVAAAPKWLVDATKRCCAADAAQRPSFKDVVSFLEDAGTRIAEVRELEEQIQKRRNRRADTLRSRDTKIGAN